MSEVTQLEARQATEFLIEDGVPIPPVNYPGRSVGPLIATLRLLNVGQSVFVQDKKSARIGPYIASARRTDQTRRFVCRSEGAGCRVWRTE